MNECDCYRVEEEIVGWYTPNSPKMALVHRCNGTKERDQCSCGGDRAKCDFYPTVRGRVPMSFLPDGNATAFGGIDPNSIIIQADKLKLYHKDLDITIDVTGDILNKIENIEINGYRFVKEKNK